VKRIWILFLLMASPASAATFTVTVPGTVTSTASGICEVLRVELESTQANWSNDLCATHLTRIGMKQVQRRATRAAAQQAVNQNVNTALDSFESEWPRPGVRAVCGDGTTDTEFGETCDDSNTTPGDGCDERCRTE